MPNAASRATKALFGAGMFLTANTFGVAAKTDDANIVIVKNFNFSPMMLTVEAGTIVSWKNLDGAPHTVVSADGIFRSHTLEQNGTFTFKFEKPGTYRYICSLHPRMMAAIIVRQATPRP